MRRAFVPLLLLAAVLLATVWFGASPAKGPVVLAASSLQEALEEAADHWVAQGHPRPLLSFAGTPALARQVEAGAPADLFVSADAQWMDTLAAKRLIVADSRVVLATNRLVIVAPKYSAVTFDAVRGMDLAAALGGGQLAMADPQAVPAGRYGKQALASLGAWDGVAGRIAGSENVRAALALVARGEAPLGLVYATDALADPRVRVVATLPAESHAPIVYPAARLATSENRDAQGFLGYLASPEGQAIFRGHGFGAPR